MALLIQHGHSEEDIGNYTIDKFSAYVRAVSRVRALDRLNTLNDLVTSIGVSLGGDKGGEFKNLIKDIRSVFK